MLAKTSKNILIVDDEVLIAFDLAAMVEDYGSVALGPYHSLDEAMAAADTEQPDAALLDINLGKEIVWPLARKLKNAGVPIVFISADLSHACLDSEFANSPKLAKPVSDKGMRAALDSVMNYADR